MRLPVAELLTTFLTALIWPQSEAHAGHDHGPEPKIGRLNQFDQMIQLHIPEMHINGDIHIGHIVQMVKQLRMQFRGTEEEKGFADYYVKVFEMIHEAKTMAIINKERQRLEDIMQGGGIKGIEAEYHWNIVNAFSELAADHLMGQMEGLGDFQRIDLNEQQGVKIKKGKKLKKKSSKAHDEL